MMDRIEEINALVWYSGGTSLDAYGQQSAASASTATSQTGKFGGGDLDSALSSLADNLSIGGKAAAASQG